MAPEAPHFHGHRQRLKARFMAGDSRAMPDYELLELLLTFAIPRREVKPEAKALLAKFGSLKAVLDADLEALSEVKGVGEQAGVLIKALRESMRRYLESAAQEADLVSSPEAAVAYCRAALEAEKRECFEVLYLASNNRLIRSERLSEGTLDRAAVYPRRVIEGALKANAAALIFVHNHPSGDPKPSTEDRRLTESLAQAAKAVGIKVHDHLVIGDGSHYSFRANGYLGSDGAG